MKKILIGMAVAVFSVNAYGACEATTKSYTSCNSGYYLMTNISGGIGDCLACPSPGSESDGGTSGISGCYVPSGTTGSDSTGSYTYSGNCYY